jgi:hypothetical protein
VAPERTLILSPCAALTLPVGFADNIRKAGQCSDMSEMLSDDWPVFIFGHVAVADGRMPAVNGGCT